MRVTTIRFVSSDLAPLTIESWKSKDAQPLADIRSEFSRIRHEYEVRPNQLQIGAEVWPVLAQHPHFLDCCKFVEVPKRWQDREQLFAAALGVDKIDIVAGRLVRLLVSTSSLDKTPPSK